MAVHRRGHASGHHDDADPAHGRGDASSDDDLADMDETDRRV